MDARRERMARNEVLFREVNERIEEVDARFGQLAEPSQLIVVCECALPDCTGQMEVPRSEYEAVRVNPKRFLVLPGHEEPRIEHVVKRDDGYTVVEKFEHEAEIAREHDSRG